jgi:membrane AbrB-like protein
MQSHPPPARPLRATVVTLLCAALGGAAFTALGLPAPWLSGAMAGATLALVARVELHVPDRLRDAVMVVLGLSMGASVTPATLAAIGRWPLSLLVLGVTVVAIMAVSVLVLRAWKWDAQTATYASAPGALSTVIALAAASNADMQRVVIAQSLRLFVLVAVLPSLIVLLEPSAGQPVTLPTTHGGSATLAQTGVEAALMLIAAAAGIGLARLARLPAFLLIGAFVGSAVIHGSGIVTVQIPQAVLVPGFVVLGAFIALRFKGTTWAGLKADFVASLVCFLVCGSLALLGRHGTAWA